MPPVLPSSEEPASVALAQAAATAKAPMRAHLAKERGSASTDDLPLGMHSNIREKNEENELRTRKAPVRRVNACNARECRCMDSKRALWVPFFD